jgi:hypothetical protein
VSTVKGKGEGGQSGKRLVLWVPGHLEGKCHLHRRLCSGRSIAATSSSGPCRVRANRCDLMVVLSHPALQGDHDSGGLVDEELAVKTIGPHHNGKQGIGFSRACPVNGSKGWQKVPYDMRR